jgi:signal transduction histidine kinase
MSAQQPDCEERYRELCEFISIVAHDLRTPLTSVRGYAQLAQRQLRGAGSTTAQASLDMILSQADRLADYTEWMLEVARIETERMVLNRAWIDLDDVIAEAAASLGITPTITRAGEESPLRVYADARRVRHIVRSMLEFAGGRFPAEAPRVHLAVRDEFGRLSVEDAGDPLEDDVRERLFSRLVHVSEDGGHRALGQVALVIAAGAAAAHGGRLDVESPVTGSLRGARLHLSLPLRAA